MFQLDCLLVHLCSLGKAASWSSLQPPGGVAGGEANEELQKKVSTLEEEVLTP